MSTSSSMSAVRSIWRRSSGWPRVRPASTKELAAVLVRQDRDLVGAELLRDLDDLLLVAVDERAQQRQLGGLLHHGQVRQRLGGDLSERVAGHECLSALAPTEGGGDLHHQPALRQHLEAPAPAVASRRWALPNETTKSRESPWKRSSRPASAYAL